MARLGHVEAFERVDEDGAQVALVKVDVGGDTMRVYHHSSPGDDAQPLDGDTLSMDDEREIITGYVDTKNEGKAGPGEKRIYARDSGGAPVAEIWLKADGTIAILAEGGTTVTLKPNGDIEIKPGNQVKIGGNPISPISLSQPTDQRFSDLETAFNNFLSGPFATHVHPDAMGGTGPTPTPATPVTPGQSTASDIVFSE